METKALKEENGLFLVFSNRVEILTELLTDKLAGFPGDPFEAQHVVVPSTAISRYLQLAIAKKNGICSNIKFSYLGRWLWHLARIVDVNVPERSPVDPEIMSWLILRFLEDGKYVSYPRLSGFIEGADDLMRLELAQSMAHVFDHYATYRPDWLMAWSKGEKISDFHGQTSAEADQEWQREIWRAVTKELNLGHAHPLQVFLETIAAKAHLKRDSGLPAKAVIFAVPVIPPLYLQTICRLAEYMEITLYMINPCREYWFEIVSPNRLAYLQGVKRSAHQEVGHSLLADWGRATQSAIDLVYEEATAAQTSETTLFIEPAGETLIERLQRSVLNMEDLTPGSAHMSTDRSIEIHCCHGAVRELEVLHDQLLERFANDHTLQTDDVLVLTPDIDTLAPAIDAVFGTAPPTHFIPYVIAGRAMATTNPYLQDLLEVLDLISSRMPASRVFDLLRQTPVARKFELDNEGLKRIRGWLSSSGIRWGIDGGHRKEMGGSGEERHTFRWGLDSLFLGVALPQLDEPLAGFLPRDSLEGSRAETLGRLWLFVERLAFWKERLRDPLPAGEWQNILYALLADFTLCEKISHGEYDRIIGAIAELADNWRAVNLTQAISARVVRAALADVDVRRRGAVPSGRITFASLSSMRGLSYRVVCLIGMNDDVHPDRERPLEFDLIHKGNPRRGDRQRRLEQRGIFLDVLLAAREALHISYTGRDQRNNAEMPPSVLVSQLIDYLAQAVAPENPTPEDLQAARTRLTVLHPLQPFSRRYFDGSDSRLFSHVRQYAAAMNALASNVAVSVTTDMEKNEEEVEVRELPPPFFTGMPAPPDISRAESPTVTMDDLFTFLGNPSKFFLQKQLLIHLPQPEDVIADEEPLTMGFLEERNAAGMIVEACRSQGRVLKVEEALAILQASPESPPGAACEAGLSLIWPDLSSLAVRVLSATTEPKLPPWQSLLPLVVNGKIWQLKANFGDLRAGGLVRYRCDELRGVDHLRAWIQHMVLCASPPKGVSLQTRHFAFDMDLSFGEISQEEAKQYLTVLLQLYNEGLYKPVPFFRKAAWAYIDKDLKAARARWFGGYHMKGETENSDIWHSLAWRGVSDPIDDAFAKTAGLIFGPIIEHRIITEAVRNDSV
jgi:exodeoxyribonuclease V gamma subunit